MLLAAGSTAFFWPASLWRGPRPPDPSPGVRALLLVGIVVLATAFRTYRMAPPGLWGDDATNGLIAYDILDGEVTSPFHLVRHASSYFHALSNYGIAAAFHVLGPSLESLRLPGVVLNLLCIPLLYATVSPLFGARTALLAAFFFSVSSMQVSFAKILVQGVSGEFLHLLGMALVVGGTTGTRRWPLALAGLPLGLSLCTYHAFKLGPLIPLLYVGLLAWQRPQARRSLARWGAAALVLLVAAAAPGILAYVDQPSTLTSRIGGTSILNTIRDSGSVAPLWSSLWRTLAIFHYQQGPVAYHWFGIGTDPGLVAPLAFLVLPGFVRGVLRWREPRHALLLLWFAIGLVPGLLSEDAPRGYRILLATPVVFVWAALPLERLLAWGTAAPAPRRAPAAIALLVLLALPVLEYDAYFVRTYTHRNHLWMQAARMVDMARSVRDRGPGWKAYLLAPLFDADHETLKLLRRMWGVEMHAIASLAEILPLRDERDVVLVLDGASLPMAEAVRSLYPTAQVEMRRQVRQRRSLLDGWWRDPAELEGRLPLAGYLPLPRAALESIRGLDVRFLDAGDLPVETQVWSRLKFDPSSRRGASSDRAVRAIATGSIHAPADDVYRFRLSPESPARVSIDGIPLLGSERRGASLALAQGLHTIAIVLDLDPPAPFELRWQRPGQPQREIAARQVYREPLRRGWLAEYRNEKSSLRRLERVPWYDFFPPTYPGRYSVRWRGDLVVPPGGRQFEVRVRGDLTMRVDGEPWERGATLAEGRHEIELLVENLTGGQILEPTWKEPQGARQRVPPEAFLPPAAVPAG